MPNYVAHEGFGQRVRGQLPPAISRAVEKDEEAFRSGLYGPDPLFFMPGCGEKAKYLHRTWQTQTAPVLQDMIAYGDAAQCSFAAGYLCHMVLDDRCHGEIYRWMAEQGLSHRALEVGLDWLLLRRQGQVRFPVPYIQDRERISRVAAPILAPARAKDYQRGLKMMGLLCRQMTVAGKVYRRKLKLSYAEPLSALLWMLEETVQEAAMLISLYHSGDMQPAGDALAAPSY